MFAASHPQNNSFLLTVVILASASLHGCFNMANGTAGMRSTVDGKISDAHYTRLVSAFQFDSCVTHEVAGGTTHFGGAFVDASLERLHSGRR
jgi:hypothetical protein